ncbi:MAG: hypothetical protein KIT34_15380 [Cyanobacteria bacterium TGS_CYA1]|nr:hypothetical protein [Cyanobacteria bacterium TGS_CYA1]
MDDKAPKNPLEDPPPPAPTPSNPAEQYLAKIIRYVPGSIIAGYTSMFGLVTQAGPYQLYLSWAIFGFCLLLAPLYVMFVPDSIPNNKDCSKRFHVVASFLSFAVWAFALGGPFASLSWYSSVYGSLALIAATLLMPLLEKVLMLINFFKSEH